MKHLSCFTVVTANGDPSTSEENNIGKPMPPTHDYTTTLPATENACSPNGRSRVNRSLSSHITHPILEGKNVIENLQEYYCEILFVFNLCEIGWKWFICCVFCRNLCLCEMLCTEIAGRNLPRGVAMWESADPSYVHLLVCAKYPR